MNNLLINRKSKILFEDQILFARCDAEVQEMVADQITPRLDDIGITGSMFAVLQHQDNTKTIAVGKNIVTDAGDEFYAYRAVEEQPPDNRFTSGAATAFDGVLVLGTAGNAPSKTSDDDDITAVVTNSTQAIDGTYPLRNDGDADNPGTVGADIITYRVSYTTANANDTAIIQALITNPSPGVAEPVLCHGTIASFNKTSSDTLKFFWNHRMNGV